MLDIAITAAKEAGQNLLEGFGKIQEYGYKTDNTITSVYDKKSEDIILTLIRQHFPNHGILTEEAGLVKAESDYLWVIDPLDGTTHFTRGTPLFSVCLALSFKKEIILSVVYNPFLNELYTAQKGKGAYLNDQRINVSNISLLDKAVLRFGWGHGEQDADLMITNLQKLVHLVRTVRNYGSCESEIAFVSNGRIDGLMDIGSKPWDYAAGSLLVLEAGGKVTDIQGQEFNLESKSIVATNGLIHDELISIIGGSI